MTTTNQEAEEAINLFNLTETLDHPKPQTIKQTTNTTNHTTEQDKPTKNQSGRKCHKVVQNPTPAHHHIPHSTQVALRG